MSLEVLQDDDIFRRIPFRMIRKEPVNGEFFAPERSEHELSAEIGVLRDIPDDPLRDVRLRCIDRDPASIGMGNGNDIVHVRVFGKQLPADDADGLIYHPCNALHGRIDRENIPGSGVPACGIRIAFPGRDRRLRQCFYDIGAEHHGIEVRRRGHGEIFLVDPAAPLHVLFHGSERDAVADDASARRDVAKSNFVRLRDVFSCYDSVPDIGSGRDIPDRYGDVIIFINFYYNSCHSL